MVVAAVTVDRSGWSGEHHTSTSDRAWSCTGERRTAGRAARLEQCLSALPGRPSPAAAAYERHSALLYSCSSSSSLTSFCFIFGQFFFCSSLSTPLHLYFFPLSSFLLLFSFYSFSFLTHSVFPLRQLFFYFSTSWRYSTFYVNFSSTSFSFPSVLSLRDSTQILVFYVNFSSSPSLLHNAFFFFLLSTSVYVYLSFFLFLSLFLPVAFLPTVWPFLT